MNKLRRYHGWILVEKNPGFRDRISTQRTTEEETEVKDFGYGANGAAKACEYFEKELNLGPVKLEQTPIGLRVFTDCEDVEGK